MTTDSASASYAISFTELVSDSVRARATLQLNEDKIEEFNKWSEGTVRLVKTILEEAARTIPLTRIRSPSLSVRSHTAAAQSGRTNQQVCQL